MSSAPVGVFLFLGAALLAGFLGHAIFRRYRVSDSLMLLAVGVTLGPMLGWIDAGWLRPVMPILGPLGLVIILFEGGLGLRWNDLRAHGRGALLFSIASWLASVAALTAALWWLVGLAPMLALLLACALGATGIVAVIPLLAHLRAPAKARVWLTVETGVGDLLSAVAVAGLATMMLTGGTPADLGAALTMRVAVGAAGGILAGVAFARALHHVGGRAHAYPVALGGLLLTYAAIETLGGSGFLAALVFGLVVGNADRLVRDAGVPALSSLSDDDRNHQGGIIFLLRSLYFVYLGASVGRELFTWQYALLGVTLTTIMLATRIALVSVSHRGDARTGILLASVMPRAMAAAVLAALPSAMGVPGTEGFLAITLLIIIGSDIATTLGVYAYERGRRAPGVVPVTS